MYFLSGIDCMIHHKKAGNNVVVERKNPGEGGTSSSIEQAFRVLSEIQPHSLPFGHTKYRHVRASIRDGVNEK